MTPNKALSGTLSQEWAEQAAIPSLLRSIGPVNSPRAQGRPRISEMRPGSFHPPESGDFMLKPSSAVKHSHLSPGSGLRNHSARAVAQDEEKPNLGTSRGI